MNKPFNISKINTVDYLKNATITGARFITKCRAGFLTIVDARDHFELEQYMKYPESIISGYKKGALQSVQVQLNGHSTWLTVFARVGKKVHFIDETILADLTVGTINQLYYNTNLYSQQQYTAVNAKTWADKAYALNGNTSVLAGIEFEMPNF